MGFAPFQIKLFGFAIIKNKREQIALAALLKRAKGSDSLFEKERFARLSQKTSDLLEKPKSKFPTLGERVPPSQ